MVNPEWSLPDILLSPSIWNIDIVEKKFGSKCKVYHLPPPTDTSLFNVARENNISKTHKRILHIAGKKAAKDRNGTNTVVEMLKHSSADYELVIATQTPLDFITKDSRLKINKDNVRNREDLYNGYDAMVLPRRYAGLCLPMNEALISGLPVFMTDISPNNQILPNDWLIHSNKIGEFKTKSMVDIYEADAIKLGNTIDNYINNDKINKYKKIAIEIGFNNFSVENLKDKWLKVINE